VVSKNYRLERVELKYIQGFENTVIEFPKSGTTLLLGDNSSGKTSLTRAIVLGVADPTNAATLLQEYQGNLIRSGCREALIRLTFKTEDGEELELITAFWRSKSLEAIEKQYSHSWNHQRTGIHFEAVPWDQLFIAGYGATRHSERKVRVSEN